MKVGCYQCNSVHGDFEANLATVLKGLEAGEKEGVELLAFPESLLTGYFEREEDARRTAFSLDSPQIAKLLEATAEFEATFMVGFNELRGEALYNTVLVAERGKLLGRYSKAFPCFAFTTPGREFPVFERKGVKFGIIICADGAFIEPSRILALKGARIIFAPHYNFLEKSWVVPHFYMVRHDHVARAVENGVWFLRANTAGGTDDAGFSYNGVGYGDSYLLDPMGQIVAHAGLHRTGLMTGEVDLERGFPSLPVPHTGNSLLSWRELGGQLAEAAKEALGRVQF